MAGRLRLPGFKPDAARDSRFVADWNAGVDTDALRERYGVSDAYRLARRLRAKGYQLAGRDRGGLLGKREVKRGEVKGRTQCEGCRQRRAVTVCRKGFRVWPVCAPCAKEHERIHRLYRKAAGLRRVR